MLEEKRSCQAELKRSQTTIRDLTVQLQAKDASHRRRLAEVEGELKSTQAELATSAKALKESRKKIGMLEESKKQALVVAGEVAAVRGELVAVCDELAASKAETEKVQAENNRLRQSHKDSQATARLKISKLQEELKGARDEILLLSTARSS